jgi:hypothetical protein
MDQQVFPKRPYLSTKLHGVTSRNTGVKTSKLCRGRIFPTLYEFFKIAGGSFDLHLAKGSDEQVALSLRHVRPKLPLCC